MPFNRLSLDAPEVRTEVVEYSVGAELSGFTIDATAANLLLDTTIKDFVVVSLSTSQVLNNADFVKVSPTSVQYVGSDRAPGEVLQLKRQTPTERYQFIRYKSTFDSAIFNEEMQRLWRRLYEASVFGIGPGSAVSNAPIDEDYGTSWANDTFRSRVAKNIYDKIESMDSDRATLRSDISANETQIVSNAQHIVTNQGNISDLDATKADTSYVNGKSYLNDPSFTGLVNFGNSSNVYVPTMPTSDSGVAAASTAFVTYKAGQRNEQQFSLINSCYDAPATATVRRVIKHIPSRLVIIEGNLARGAYMDSGDLGIIPIGYRPTQEIIFPVFIAFNNNAIVDTAYVLIKADGSMQMYTGSYLSSRPEVSSISQLRLAHTYFAQA